MIYFLHCPEAKRIKIGKSRSPLGRISALQAACPFEADLIGCMYGYTVEEGELHRRFWHHHAKGEWFHDHAEIMDFVKSLPNAVRYMLDRCPEWHKTGPKFKTTRLCPECGVSHTSFICHTGPFVPERYCSDECAAKPMLRTVKDDSMRGIFREEVFGVSVPELYEGEKA